MDFVAIGEKQLNTSFELYKADSYLSVIILASSVDGYFQNHIKDNSIKVLKDNGLDEKGNWTPNTVVNFLKHGTLPKNTTAISFNDKDWAIVMLSRACFNYQTFIIENNLAPRKLISEASDFINYSKNYWKESENA